ncbi:hypothetical protein HDU98_011071 [Podochytrium sp. JEL0797]|nr:hypothetical protein HDU98_011071 [Podochytrium sp. JEL0797]
MKRALANNGTSKKLKPDQPALSPPPGNPARSCVIHCFRNNDLRIANNTALSQLHATYTNKLPIIGLFILSPIEWHDHEMAPIKVRFLLQNLASLRARLEVLGIPMVVRTAPGDRKTVSAFVRDTAVELGAECISWNWEYEVHEEERDGKTMDLLKEAGIQNMGFHDQCIIDTSRVRTKQGNPYTVFTPFKKTWIETIVKNSHLVKPPAPIESNTAPVSAALMSKIKALTTSIPATVPPPFVDPPESVCRFADATFPPGEDAALARLNKFIEERGSEYKETRDFPGMDKTSRLSPYLAVGAISTRTCLLAALKANNGKYDSGKEGFVTWISELCWRDFYRNILIEFPRVSKNLPFKLDTDRVLWASDRTNANFQKWCTGTTGYPIVDAGMRQLQTEGWMHNRVRMIVASFLTKDLGVDWRLGESWFMQNLIDGDLASNNGGWQWAASTGTDSQPYFRIFNPKLQSERFDPEGGYIRKYVKELKGVKGKDIHDPKGREKLGYPQQVVDHKVASKAFLEVFKTGIGKE